MIRTVTDPDSFHALSLNISFGPNAVPYCDIQNVAYVTLGYFIHIAFAF